VAVIKDVVAEGRKDGCEEWNVKNVRGSELRVVAVNGVTENNFGEDN